MPRHLEFFGTVLRRVFRVHAIYGGDADNSKFTGQPFCGHFVSLFSTNIVMAVYMKGTRE
jgi:hypothetical protein